MKNLKFMIVAIVAMLGFSACDNKCDHEFIEYDYRNDIVGTWTCLEANYAEALVINADGSVVSTGVENGEYWEDVKGNIKTINNKMTLTFEDDDNYEGRFEMVAGEAFTIFEENGKSLTYRYCKEDLSDEIVGMWVATTGPYMSIEVFNEDGSAIYTGFVPESEEMAVTSVTSYKVIGDLQFHTVAEDNSTYVVHRLIYSPSSQTSLGEIMTWQVDENISFPRLRIKQNLDLEGKKYDYNNVYVSNVKGEDKDIEFMGLKFNFAKMDGSELDKLLKAILFDVEFTDANTLSYSYQYNNVKKTLDARVVVEGNKMIVKMSEEVSTLKDVELYAFQDADCSQMHFYMSRDAFVNFHANMQAILMESTDEQFDINNAEAVNAIYNNINEAVESINVSLVMK